MSTFEYLVRNGSIINTTPHPANFLVGEGDTEFVVPPSLDVRVTSTSSSEIVDGIWSSTSWEKPTLPEPIEGKVFYVSLAVSSAMKEHGIKRDDIFIGRSGPGSDARRHPEKGFVTGIRSFEFANN